MNRSQEYHPLLSGMHHQYPSLRHLMLHSNEFLHTQPLLELLCIIAGRRGALADSESVTYVMSPTECLSRHALPGRLESMNVIFRALKSAKVAPQHITT